MKSKLVGTLFSLAAAGSALAQASGFSPGEILHYSPYVTAFTVDGGAILRLDPASGTTSVVLPLGESLFRAGAMCYDPFRDRVLFFGSPTLGAFMRLWQVDASGNLEDLGFESQRLYLLTPGASGKVYFHDESGDVPYSPLRYLDAQNVRHDLLDADGGAPYTWPRLDWATAMGYDPTLHALLVAIRGDFGQTLCAGGSDLALTVLRLDLSADGTRVTSTSCTQALPDPLGANLPVSLSPMPGGDWLIGVDTNSNDVQPRMLRLDPASLAITTYASNGPYTGAAITDAACFSSVRGEALLLDDYNGRLLGFAPFGIGVPLATSMPLTFPGIYGFEMTMREVQSSGCPAPTIYCAAKTSSSGCVPSIGWSGSPSASAGAGFTLRATQVEAHKNGLLFYSTTGPSSAPFQGGTLCAKPPIKRTAVTNSNGTSACSGVLATDFNQWIAAGTDGALVLGASVWAQFWFRDPGAAFGTGLSDAATFLICP